MGLVSNRVKREDIKRGDHIYTYRAGFTYSHHGIFAGENKVVHFTPDQKGKASSAGISSSSSSNFPGSLPCPTSPYCGLELLPGSGVVVSCLDCFLRKGSPYLYKYGVSPAFFLAKVRGGSCTTAPSDPPEIVIHRAAYLLQNGFGNYCVLLNNCEGFALYCKTGLVITSDSKPASVRKEGVGRSGQTLSIAGSSGQTLSIACVPLSAIMSLPLVLLIPTPVGLGLGLAATGLYCVTRYVSDIGVRTNAVKVAVEDLAAKLGWDRGKKDP